MLRKRLFRTIWWYCFITCLFCSYFLYQIVKISTYPNGNSKSRADFLDNTFCGKIINGTWQKTINESEITTHNRLIQQRIQDLEKVDYQNLSCTEFINNNGFYSKHITNLEYNNPMAFSILIYKNLYQFQVLMRTLYVRSNFHCIHVDKNAPLIYFDYAVKLSLCLENVYIAIPRIKVSWGTMSILEAERICQIYLLQKSSKWHYYMTIAGSELPIQTNLNRIQILQVVPDKSRNDVCSFPQPFSRQGSKKSPLPANTTIYKGEFHSILTRDFIQAVHTSPLVLKYWSFLDGTAIPDEQFYPTLVHLSELPGGKARGTSSYTFEQLVSHFKSWVGGKINTCQSGQYYSSVCQYNYKDLRNIEESGRLFANKFNQDRDLVGIDCWEQWLNVKQTHHQDIDVKDYVDKFPFTRKL